MHLLFFFFFFSFPFSSFFFLQFFLTEHSEKVLLSIQSTFTSLILYNSRGIMMVVYHVPTPCCIKCNPCASVPLRNALNATHVHFSPLHTLCLIEYRLNPLVITLFIISYLILCSHSLSIQILRFSSKRSSSSKKLFSSLFFKILYLR